MRPLIGGSNAKKKNVKGLVRLEHLPLEGIHEEVVRPVAKVGLYESMK